MMIKAKYLLVAGAQILLMICLPLGVLAAAIIGIAGVIAWADMQYVCPDGNQCSDAKRVVALSLVLVPAGIATSLFSWSKIRLKRRAT